MDGVDEIIESTSLVEIIRSKFRGVLWKRSNLQV